MKDMLTQNDLKQIGDLLDTKLDEKLDSRLGEVLEAVNKGFSDVQEQIHGVKQNVAGLDRRMTRVEATMVTKDYLDEKFAPINGKINVLVDVLHRNGTISGDQRHAVHA